MLKSSFSTLELAFALVFFICHVQGLGLELVRPLSGAELGGHFMTFIATVSRKKRWHSSRERREDIS